MNSTSASYSSSADGSYRVETSISPRRRQVVISSGLQRQAGLGGGAQRAGDLRLRYPEQAQHPVAVLGRAGDRGPERLGPAGRLPHRLKLARRPGQHHDGRPGPFGGGTTSPGAVPTGSSTVAPSGIIACLRFEIRIASRSRLGQRCISPARISSIRASRPGSSTISRPLKRAHDLGGEVVGGRTEAAAGDDQRHPLAPPSSAAPPAGRRADRRRSRSSRCRPRSRAAARIATARCGRR